MGGTAGGFMSGLMGVLGPKIEERHQQEEDRKKELRGFYLKALADPNVSDAGRQEAQQQLLKLMNPEAKKGFGKIAPILGKVVGLHAQAQPQSGNLGGGAPAQTGSGQLGSGAPEQTGSGALGSRPMDERLPNGQPAMSAGTGRQGLFMAPGPAEGLLQPGNIDLTQLPVVQVGPNEWGTVRSASREVDGKEILYPTIIEGRPVSDDEAFAYAMRTGKNLGVFKDGASADKYAQRLHEDWQAGKIPGVQMRNERQKSRDATVRGPQRAPQPQGGRQATMQGPNLSGIYGNYGTDTAKREQDQRIQLEDQEYQSWLKRGKDVLGPNANPRDLAEYAGSKGQRLPAQTHRVADKGVARPGEDPNTGKPFEGLWDHTVEPDGTETWAKRPDVSAKKGGYIRQGQQTALADAKQLAAQGHTFKDAEGNDIDVNKLPPNMALQAMIEGDKIFYIPVSPNQKTVTVGNQVYAVLPTEVKGIAQGQGTALGESRVPTASTGQTPVFNPQTGEFEMFTTHRTSTPAAPGAAGRPAGPTPAPAPIGAKPATTVPAAKPQGPTPAPTSSMGSRIPAGQYRGVIEKAIPVQEAATQIFGDPTQPDLKGLKDYIDLADNAQSREKLGKALRLTFDGLNQSTGGANISAGAGPISVSTGGIGQVLQNYFGVPQTLAEQQSKIMQGAIADLSPQEREAYDAVMSAFSTVVGLRSLTRASAAQASVSAIERELPVIGVNTFDSRQFADQLQRLAEVVNNGVNQLPKGALNPALRDRINKLPGDMQKLKQARGPAQAPQGSLKPKKKGDKLTDRVIVQQYVDKANGDKEKARKMARDDGWDF